MGSIAPTPPYGKRLIPVLIDEIASSTPSRIFCSIPRSSDISLGFTDITYGQFALAINRSAAFIEETFGRSESFQTLAYLGVSDVRYMTFLIGACKVGWKLLLPSPRNSLEGHLDLLQATNSLAILTSYPSPLPSILKSSALPIHSVPSLSDLISPKSTGKETKKYIFQKSFEEAKMDPFVIIHTSGSTGLPKPITLRHGYFSTIDAFNELPPLAGCEPVWNVMRGARMLSTLPPFHAAGLFLGLLNPIFMDVLPIWGPEDRPTSELVVEQIMDTVPLDIVFLAPFILEEMVQDPITRVKLEKLKAVGFSGGPLSQKAGDMICSKVKIINIIGSTEMANVPLYTTSPKDWSYIHYDPSLTGIQFRPLPYDKGIYEFVIVRDPSTDRFHSAWYTFPDLQEWKTNDLYEKHPTKDGLWKCIGRKDDVIVLSNGEKINPTGMQTIIGTHPAVMGALVVGHGKFTTAVIIELKPEVAEELKNKEEKARFVEEEIWKVVVEANKSAPTHAHVGRDKIVLSDPEKPFLRAGKGTVQRGRTLKLYAEEIERIYRGGQEEISIAEVDKIDVKKEKDEVETRIGGLLRSVIGLKELGREDDLFTAGMDSLHVMTTVKLLKVALIGVGLERVNTRLIYANPTIRTLVSALKQLSPSTNGTTNGSAQAKSQEEIMEETLNRYTQQLPSPSSKSKEIRQTGEPLTVLLTGSTGSLGSYLLHTLISSTRVSKVYCINRRADAEERQANSMSEKGLISKWDGKVEFLYAGLSKASFGLEKALYKRLESEVDVIIHNQWQVNFNLSLKSFEPHMEGALNLIKFSTSAATQPPIFFTSSIGTLGNFPTLHPRTLVPETPLTDPRIPLPQGYSQSKWITERLLAAAAKKSNISSTILRVGQITGPVEMGIKGSWNRSEWLPSIIASSKFLGCVPGTLPGQEDVAWVPVDLLSRIILELVEDDVEKANGGEAWTKYYHLTNPKKGRWEDLIPMIKEYFSSQANGDAAAKKEISVVSFQEWVQRLEESGRAKDVKIEKNPAVKLLEFYKGMMKEVHSLRLDTKKTEDASEAMRDLRQVNGEWMRLWLEQWGF